jgi:NADPH:quinone reductase-like Zn-dependent oxidoreductase
MKDCRRSSGIIPRRPEKDTRGQGVALFGSGTLVLRTKRAKRIHRVRMGEAKDRGERMRAACYEKQGPAGEVLKVGEMPDPSPAPGEVRIRTAASGINPGDIKKRQDAFGYGMPYPRVIPHCDGAGKVDQIGAGVSTDWLGRSVWCYGAQSYRPFGTAAEFTVVPVGKVAPLPANVSREQRMSRHTPGITDGRCWNATNDATPPIPFWLMVFKNIRVFFLGSDDFPEEAERLAAEDLNAALEAGWPGFEIGERIPLEEIVRARELAEHPVRRGRIVLTMRTRARAR